MKLNEVADFEDKLTPPEQVEHYAEIQRSIQLQLKEIVARRLEIFKQLEQSGTAFVPHGWASTDTSTAHLENNPDVFPVFEWRNPRDPKKFTGHFEVTSGNKELLDQLRPILNKQEILQKKAWDITERIRKGKNRAEAWVRKQPGYVSRQKVTGKQNALAFDIGEMIKKNLPNIQVIRTSSGFWKAQKRTIVEIWFKRAEPGKVTWKMGTPNNDQLKEVKVAISRYLESKGYADFSFFAQKEGSPEDAYPNETVAKCSIAATELLEK